MKGDHGASVTESQVKQFMKTTLKIPSAETFEFQAVHRLPGGQKDKKNIIARFVRLRDKDVTMSSLRNLKPNCGFSVAVDLPPKLNELRNNLLHTRSKMEPAQKAKTKLVYLKEPPFLRLQAKQGGVP